jgi:hypothetical protein
VKATPFVFAIYGFFFMASYPMVEGALMSSVPHQIRGRVFGVFITIGGNPWQRGALGHGRYVKDLGPASGRAESYYQIYGLLSGLLITSLLGLPCLRALRRREVAQGELPQECCPKNREYGFAELFSRRFARCVHAHDARASSPRRGQTLKQIGRNSFRLTPPKISSQSFRASRANGSRSVSLSKARS